MTEDSNLAPFTDEGGLRLAPTDVAQFIRLDQCQRYLRLRLTEQNRGRHFLKVWNVQPQAIPPLLTRSGRLFEERVEADIRAAFATFTCDETSRKQRGRQDDNDLLVNAAERPMGSEPLVILQPRITAMVEGWNLRGIADMVRFDRTSENQLEVRIIDFKSSTAAKVEHRLQVAFYQRMLEEVLKCAERSAEISIGILYRGVDEDPANDSDQLLASQKELARELLGSDAGYLEMIADPRPYLGAVADLVTSQNSVANRTATAHFADLPFHLTYKCDGCLYNEFCLRWCAEHDDLSLLPHLMEHEKTAFIAAGVRTNHELAILKEPPPYSPKQTLAARPESAALARQLAATWPIGPRLDELIHRARRYRRFKGDDLSSVSFIPESGYPSLPHCGADHDPNLVRVYIDAQHDYLHDRVYLLGALISAAENGVESTKRRRLVVELADGPPESAEMERELLVRWIDRTIQAIVELAAPDANGEQAAPIHLIFYDRYDQRVLLEALGRHGEAVLGATALYDFVTQLAAFDSSISTFLHDEIRAHKNYPLVCQSLQSVAAFLKFDWNAPLSFRQLFHARYFDYTGRFDEEEQPHGTTDPWYLARSRFNSQIPLEYAYGAWGALDDAEVAGKNDLAKYRAVTPDMLTALHSRRLEAIEHISHDFRGNERTFKRAFSLPDLSDYENRARSMADALDEFLTLERHAELAEWKNARHAAPERRMLAGTSLLVRYVEADQAIDVRVRNRQNLEQWNKAEALKSRVDDVGQPVPLSKPEKDATRWSQDGLVVRLRLEMDGVDCSLDHALTMNDLAVGNYVVISRRLTFDSRLPIAERVMFTPTPKQLLYGSPGILQGIEVERNEAGEAQKAWANVELQDARFGLKVPGFSFTGYPEPFAQEELYTIDESANSPMGAWAKKTVAGLIAVGDNTIHQLLEGTQPNLIDWPEPAVSGQEAFLQGLDQLHERGHLAPMNEVGKRQFIGGLGDSPCVLVQGPPGTGKSYTTAYAVLARMQGAMAAGRPLRVLIACKTHAATDVLLRNVRDSIVNIRRSAERDGWETLAIDDRIVDIPLWRINPRGATMEGVIPLKTKAEKGETTAVVRIDSREWCVVAGTPGGIYKLLSDRWGGSALFGHELFDVLVLDEASQMSLPEAVMASLPLKPSGQIIVVGDHRQMPPIVQHNWLNEARRTFAEYKAYESLFLALKPIVPEPAQVKFEESYRLHRDIAEFLRQEIYFQDGIPYFSRKTAVLPISTSDDPFVQAVIDPSFPLIVIVHQEASSQVRNPFEQRLIAPVLETLRFLGEDGLDPRTGLGVVVPHRAQRTALQESQPSLVVRDPLTGLVTLSAVDTVERFQGDEREAIMVSATESDRQYLLTTSEFLLDPRRLTVALSRAKRKMILVGSRSVFELFSPDEETFANAQIWKNLLRRTCTVPLWRGEREGYPVEVWGNRASVNGDQTGATVES